MLPKRYFEFVPLIDEFLDRMLPAEKDWPLPIHQAMRYSLFAGGKRLRPVLCLMVAETFGASPGDYLPLAGAIEMIHTYSLIHDDLPCMDNDDFRRGKPTCHKVFGEAMATLAGDALLTAGFELLVNSHYAPDIRCRLISELAAAIGTRGMIGGQVMDMTSQSKIPNRLELEKLQAMKTAALIGFAAKSPLIILKSGAELEAALSYYGQMIGLAFQIVDDVLDVEGETETLGKTAGKDRKQEKLTYPSVIGLEESKRLAADLVETAVSGVRSHDTHGHLNAFATFVLNRQK